MLNHGITTGALFMLVGAIYERTHSREIADNLGLAKYLPAYIGFFGLFSMSSLGFPGTNSFVGEALVLIGAFQNNVIIGALAIPGAMIAAAYMLRLLQKLAWGAPTAGKKLADLDTREWAYILPLAILVIYLGLAPTLTRLTIDASIPKTINRIQTVLKDKRPDLVSHMNVNTQTPRQGVQ
jgi:NADH-quinone oxidoreductase subunit M